MSSMFKTKSEHAMLIGSPSLLGRSRLDGRKTFVGDEEFLNPSSRTTPAALPRLQDRTSLILGKLLNLQEKVESQQQEISQMQSILDRYDSDSTRTTATDGAPYEVGRRLLRCRVSRLIPAAAWLEGCEAVTTVAST